MTNRGFEESPAPYRGFSESVEVGAIVGQFRRFGETGPAYEVMRIASESHVAIRVVYTGEELDYNVERLRRDPLAITIP